MRYLLALLFHSHLVLSERLCATSNELAHSHSRSIAMLLLFRHVWEDMNVDFSISLLSLLWYIIFHVFVSFLLSWILSPFFYSSLCLFYSATTKSHLSCVLYPVQCLWWKFCFLFHCVLLPIYSSDENYVTTKYETMYNAHWNALESIWLIAVMCKDLVHFHDHKGRMHCANPFLNFIICFIFIKSILLECISRNMWQWITG